MKQLSIILVTLSLIVISVWVFRERLNGKIEQNNQEILVEEQITRDTEDKALVTRLQRKADIALLYAKEKGFDLNHAFLVDFSIHSGKHRFFVWNFKANSVELSSLCAHGMGKGAKRSTYSDIVFSNEEGSYCSSLGRYKIGARSYSNWGINVHYKLHGLEETNDNAYQRIVVLHSHSPIPQEEVYPDHLPLGYSMGCPVIDDVSMTSIDNMLKGKTKPVLLWIYI